MRTRRSLQGFTLIELLIVLVVVAILAAVAVPGYQEQLRASRRAEAREALMRIQAAQERWRSNNASYADSVAALGLPSASMDGNYALSVSAASAAGYTATATAKARQAGDTPCAAIIVTVAPAGAALQPMTYSPAACWGR